MAAVSPIDVEMADQSDSVTFLLRQVLARQDVMMKRWEAFEAWARDRINTIEQRLGSLPL